MRLRDVLDPRRHAACTVGVDGTVATAVSAMSAAAATVCVVLGGECPVGMFTAGDLLRCHREGAFLMDTPVRQIMSANPLIAGADDPAVTAADDMMRRGVHHLPVMDGAALAGVLRLADLAAAVIGALQAERLTLEEYIADLHAARED